MSMLRGNLPGLLALFLGALAVSAGAQSTPPLASGVTEDAASAAQLYDRACRGADASGCNSLGYFYERGRAVDLDASRAAQLYERACQLANPSGCDNLAVLYEGGNGVTRDRNRAAKLRQQACELAPRPSCRRD